MLREIISASKLSQHSPHLASDNGQSSTFGITCFLGYSKHEPEPLAVFALHHRHVTFLMQVAQSLLSTHRIVGGGVAENAREKVANITAHNKVCIDDIISL